MARVRAKRTEWRMRGIEPNKNVTSFSPHPSCLRDASAIHLPARSIATSPLWLKTVTCGLFLRCFAPPRRAPDGESLIGYVHDCHLGALVEKSHTIETGTVVYVMRRDEGVPPYRRLRRESNTIVISSVSREVSLREKRNFTHSRQPTRQRGLRAEKASAVKMKITEYDHTKYLPARKK